MKCLRTPTLAALAAYATLTGAGSHAAASEDSLETLIVTGTRLPLPTDALPGALTLIDRQAIESRAPASALEMLREVPGLHVSQYGGRGGVSSVFVQGAEPNFTLVMIDGVKVNDPNNSRGGSFNFANLNLAEIERIDIVRGPVSSVYGSDGLSGIINIITRDFGDQAGATIEAEAGEQGHLRAAALVNLPFNAEHGAVASVTHSQDGDAVGGNDYDNLTANLRLRGRSAVAYDISARYTDSRAEAFPEDSGGPQLAVLRSLDQRDYQQLSFASRLSYPVNERWQVNLSASYLDQQEDQTSPGIAPGVRDGVPPTLSDATLQRLNLGMHSIWQANDSLAAVFGLDYQDEDGEQQGSIELFPGFSLPSDFQLERETLGVFGELRFRHDSGFSASASLRHDDPDDQSAESTARLGVSQDFGTTRLHASWGEGFKLPSFFALGHALVGNPSLRPETSRSLSAGIDQQLADHWQIGIVAFENTYDDLIDFDFDLFTNVNRNKVETRGFELTSQLQASPTFFISGHVTYVDIDLGGSAGKLRQRPDWRGGINLQWQATPFLHASIAYLHVGDSFDTSVPTGAMTLEDYQRIDANLTWQPNERMDVWLAIDNINDETYEESIGFRAPGTRTRIGIRMRL